VPPSAFEQQHSMRADCDVSRYVSDVALHHPGVDAREGWRGTLARWRGRCAKEIGVFVALVSQLMRSRASSCSSTSKAILCPMRASSLHDSSPVKSSMDFEYRRFVDRNLASEFWRRLSALAIAFGSSEHCITLHMVPI
jgi:hypothetical protein